MKKIKKPKKRKRIVQSHKDASYILAKQEILNKRKKDEL